MAGYQSDTGGGIINFLRNKGFYFVTENVPFPSPGIKNDVWMIETNEGEGGQVGTAFSVENGDILICLRDNPGGFGVASSWLVIPRAANFEEEQEEEEEEP